MQDRADQYDLMHNPSHGHAPSMMGMSPSNASNWQLSDMNHGVSHHGSSTLWGQQDHGGTLR